MEKSDEEKSQIAKAAVRTRTLNALKINILEIRELLSGKNIPFDMVPNDYEYIRFHHNEYHPVIILYYARNDECLLHIGVNRKSFGYSELEKNELSEYIKNMLEK